MSNFGNGGDLGRIERRSYRQKGLSRQQRLTVTLVVTAVLLVGVGVAIGFAWGRSSAPEPEPQPVAQAETTLPAGVVEEVPTESVDPDLAVETEVSEEEQAPPPTPRQTSPKNNARIDASRVYLRWTAIEDDSGDPVTYAFEIQDRLSGGSYGKTQVITGLKSTSYSARVLYVTRRWRVWAVDEAGNKSEKSGWRYYKHTPRPAPKPAPSDETT